MTTFSILMVLKYIAIAAVFITVAGFLVMLLWNWLVPNLFKGPIIKFKHALGLMALSFLLFGGFRGGRHWSGHCGTQYENCGAHHEKCLMDEHTAPEPKN